MTDMPEVTAEVSRPGIDDPEIAALISSPDLPRGHRGDAILLVMNAAGKSGWSNHEILALGSELADRWGKYPSSNLYRHWSHLLAMLRNVRSHYPQEER